MKKKVTKGELMDRAKVVGVDPDQRYEELREQIEIKECKHCGDEFLVGFEEDYCDEACQVEYLHEAGFV